MSETAPPRPDPPLPEHPARRRFRLLLWVSGVTNALLLGLLLAGWVSRPPGCVAGCPVQLPARWLVIVLLLVDIGVMLLWVAIGYGSLLRLGASIGERINDRRGRQD